MSKRSEIDRRDSEVVRDSEFDVNDNDMEVGVKNLRKFCQNCWNPQKSDMENVS